MSSSVPSQTPQIRGPEKVIWIKIPPPPSGGVKRVFFASGNAASPNHGWFDLTGTKARAWVLLLAESMASAINIEWVPDSTVQFDYDGKDTVASATATVVLVGQTRHDNVTKLF
jgi:hypothetical protein